jgi:hypothetical protein
MEETKETSDAILISVRQISSGSNPTHMGTEGAEEETNLDWGCGSGGRATARYDGLHC